MMAATDPLRRLTKRQRLEEPICWMDCESVDTVVAPVGGGNRHNQQQQQQQQQQLIQTPLASQLTSEIFLDRLQKEILTPFRFSLSSQLQLLDHNDGKEDTVHAAKERRRVLQSRLRIGLNACIRALEEACSGSTIYGTGGPQPPTLLVLTDEAAGTNNAKQHGPARSCGTGAPNGDTTAPAANHFQSIGTTTGNQARDCAGLCAKS